MYIIKIKIHYSIMLLRNVFPFISFVVATTNSTFESSCCERKRRAEIYFFPD